MLIIFEKQVNQISTWNHCLMSWKTIHVPWLFPLEVELTCHKETMKEDKFYKACQWQNCTSVTISCLLLSLPQAFYLRHGVHVILWRMVFTFPSLLVFILELLYNPFSSRYCAGYLFDKPDSLESEIPQRPINIVNRDMMGRGHFCNLTLYGIIGFIYSDSALIDSSDFELSLKEVPIHFYTEFSVSFSRALCWLSPTVLFPHVPVELFSYLWTRSTIFHMQKTPTRLIWKKHMATFPLQAPFGHIQSHVQDIHNLKILSIYWFLQHIM